MNDLKGTILRLEGDLRHVEEERKILVGDITSVTNLKAKVEFGKDQAQRQLDAKIAELEEVNIIYEFF